MFFITNILGGGNGQCGGGSLKEKKEKTRKESKGREIERNDT